MERKLVAGTILIVLGMGLFAPLGSVEGQPFVESVTLVDKTLSGRRLEMHVAAASVEIAPWEQSDIRVQAIQTQGSPGDFTVEVGQEGDTVWVRERVAPYRSFSRRRLQYVVSVPKKVSINVTTGSGNVRNAFPLRDSQAHRGALTGTVGDGSATLQITVSSGNITLENIALERQ